MPKAKPTHVIVHRIELQEKEREMIEPLINSKAISNITLPVAAGAAVYVGYKIGHAAFGWTEDLFDNIKKNMKTAKEKRDEKLTRDSFENPFNNDGFADDGTPTNIFGLPGWGIWPGVL
jgi:hypothetical protein